MNYYELVHTLKEEARSRGLLVGDKEHDAAIENFIYGVSHKMAEQFEAAIKESDFGKGARAVFDNLLMRAANHWHANPEINAECDKDNALITEWATEALEDVSPTDCATWHEIGKLQARIYELEQQLKTK